MREIFEEILAERKRQDKKWGERNHPMLKAITHTKCWNKLEKYRELNRTPEKLCWHTILLEEVYEAFAVGDAADQRKEMIQVAAVAVAIVEYLDRIEGGKP